MCQIVLRNAGFWELTGTKINVQFQTAIYDDCSSGKGRKNWISTVHGAERLPLVPSPTLSEKKLQRRFTLKCWLGHGLEVLTDLKATSSPSLGWSLLVE